MKLEDIEIFKDTDPLVYQELLAKYNMDVVVNERDEFISELRNDPYYADALDNPQFMDVINDVFELKWQKLLMYAKSMGVSSYGRNMASLRKEVVAHARKGL